MSDPADEPAASTGPPDRQTLRLLERHMAADPLVAETEFGPNPHESRRLAAHLGTDSYPPSISSARIDVRWVVTDEFSFHYVERSGENRWECRWDRHPNAHSSRLHVHEPPTGETVSALDLPSTHPLDVYSTVLDAIETRLDAVW